MGSKTGLTRRDMLKAAGGAFGLATIGCHSSDQPADANIGLLGEIDTFVVLCMENRSFDHYLGSRRLLEGVNIDGLRGGETNPAPDGSIVPSYRMDEFVTPDIDHSWEACHGQWDSGRNDGFVIQHAGPNQNDPMGYHVRQQLPTTYQLADAFTTCDKWFASVMGPTWPNRFFLHGASSHGVMTNDPVAGFSPIFDLLDFAHVTQVNYFHDIPWATGGYHKIRGFSPIENFFTDAAAGTLPQYTLIDPHFLGVGANDDHPDHDPMLGQALIASVYAALAQSPQWDRCLFVLTYDEHGGFFDHVVPPQITSDTIADFQQLGFRVPSIVAGPRVRLGATVSDQLEHVSILSSLTRRFELETLNARVAATTDLSVCLDPTTSRRRPAPQLDPVEISLTALHERPSVGNHHHELLAAANQGLIPKHLDRRGESLDITMRVLRHGERLGAVRLVY